MKLVCQVYRSTIREETYLYVDKARGLEDVPDVLMQQFGEPRAVMTLLLTPERRLARADVAAVMAQIQAQGFYLQMPPTTAELLRREGAIV